jgi:uncharacterized protein (DUF302 family)
MSYAITTSVHRPFTESLSATRQALSEQGFGILTEIDMQATLKAKLNVDIRPQVILGACRPLLAHAALQAEPSIGLLLPCNVVVRAQDERRTKVEAMDPDVMISMTNNPNLAPVAADARTRLRAALESLSPAQQRSTGHGRTET